MDQLVFEGYIQLEKMPMKGGWTYALLPSVIKGGKKNFGWAKLNAYVDDHEMLNASLMPVKGGRLFLAVKAEIRKKIGKEAGDTVHVKLYGKRPEEDISEVDFMEALRDDPDALANFGSFPEKEQASWLQWIFAASGTDAVVRRMAEAINEIAKGRFCKANDKKK